MYCLDCFWFFCSFVWCDYPNGDGLRLIPLQFSKSSCHRRESWVNPSFLISHPGILVPYECLLQTTWFSLFNLESSCHRAECVSSRHFPQVWSESFDLNFHPSIAFSRFHLIFFRDGSIHSYFFQTSWVRSVHWFFFPTLWFQSVDFIFFCKIRVQPVHLKCLFEIWAHVVLIKNLFQNLCSTVSTPNFSRKFEFSNLHKENLCKFEFSRLNSNFFVSQIDSGRLNSTLLPPPFLAPKSDSGVFVI